MLIAIEWEEYDVPSGIIVVVSVVILSMQTFQNVIIKSGKEYADLVL